MKWSILGDSVAGTSHRERDAECQDACRFRTFGTLEEWLVIAVADGAGSAAHSAAGSKRACDEFIRLVENSGPHVFLTREGLIALFAEVRSALFEEAARLDVAPREVACTALLAIVGPT